MLYRAPDILAALRTLTHLIPTLHVNFCVMGMNRTDRYEIEYLDSDIDQHIIPNYIFFSK